MAVRSDRPGRSIAFRRSAVLSLAVLVTSVVVYAPRSSSKDSITTPHTSGNVGTHTSLVLDGAGNPVVSYYNATNDSLSVLHCDDPACSGVGDSITSPDPSVGVGWYTSLALDAAGNPVVSYYDYVGSRLKVLHCNDPACAGGGDTVTTPDLTSFGGDYTSLVLDDAGNPVVAYYDATNSDLKVLHCDDPACSGGDDSIASPDTTGRVGSYPSIALDSLGNPVVSYYGDTFQQLRLLHCGDPLCAGDENTIHSPDPGGGDPGQTSLVLDSDGNPVVSYFDASDGGLKVLHCANSECSSGRATITRPDKAGETFTIGLYSSLVLDPAGNPVISYYDSSRGELKVLHCDDPACAPGGDSISTPDEGPEGIAGAVGAYSSLALDSSGHPVVAYYGSAYADLKVLHCDNPVCGPGPTAVGDEYATAQVTTLIVPVPGVLGNDIESRNLSISASILGSPSHGVAILANDGSFMYRPDKDYVGVDSFAYQVSDGIDSALGSVSISVSAATVFCAGRAVSMDMTAGASGIGTAGDDVILGTAGADTIDGAGGDDVICGEGGNDSITGGDGLDFIFGGDGNDTMSGGDGNDRIRGGPGVDIISGGLGNDFLYGGIEGDTIDGGDGNDTIGGFGGHDTINAGSGNDLVFGGFGRDIINGGPGQDDLRGLIGDDVIHGDGGNDTISGDNGRDQIHGDAGNDLLFGGNSLDTIDGNDGDDNLNGGKANDTLTGGAGVDVCTGNLGTDTATSCETAFGVP